MGSKLDERSQAWAKALHVALKKWLRANDYISGAQLAKELGIGFTTWSHIQSGGSLSLAENYARIYLRTGLAEADPRKIPSRVRAFPNRAPKTEARAWTGGQYQAWLEKNRAKHRASAPVLPTVTALGGYQPTEADGIEVTFATFFAGLQALMIRLQPGHADPNDLETLVARLKEHFDRAISGTAIDRDRFQTEYGEAVKQLLNMADALTLPDREERENAVLRIKEFGEVKT
ncbi:MAG: hypothetical protein AAB486_04450 [Patescibacteria group bacterium]